MPRLPPTIAILSIVLVLGGPGCRGSDGSNEPPKATESDVLREGSWTYPGGTEAGREFREATDKTDIHGQDSSTDASLRRDVTFTKPVLAADVLAWYSERLERDGWVPISEPTKGSIRYASSTTYFHHKLSISTPADRSISTYTLTYELSDR